MTRFPSVAHHPLTWTLLTRRAGPSGPVKLAKKEAKPAAAAKKSESKSEKKVTEKKTEKKTAEKKKAPATKKAAKDSPKEETKEESATVCIMLVFSITKADIIRRRLRPLPRLPPRRRLQLPAQRRLPLLPPRLLLLPNPRPMLASPARLLPLSLPLKRKYHAFSARPSLVVSPRARPPLLRQRLRQQRRPLHPRRRPLKRRRSLP